MHKLADCWDDVFPMYVGVILSRDQVQTGDMGIPHVCGGDPAMGDYLVQRDPYSPCMWG